MLLLLKSAANILTILVHTGQNYDYNLSGVFFKDLGLADPELYLDPVGTDLGETMGNIIDASYKAMAETNRRIVDIISDMNLAYFEHARRYLADCGLPKERTYVTGSSMAEVLTENLEAIQASDVHARLGLEKGKYILLSAHREENIDTEKNFTSLFTAINRMAEKYDMPILYSCHPRSRKRLEASCWIPV